MPSEQDKAKRRRPRIRLWHLFAIVALAAVLVWLWPRVGLEVNHQPGTGSRVVILWHGNPTELWDTFQPPPPQKAAGRVRTSAGMVLDTNDSADMMGVEIRVKK